jgi:hypothetical protein
MQYFCQYHNRITQHPQKPERWLLSCFPLAVAAAEDDVSIFQTMPVTRSRSKKKLQMMQHYGKFTTNFKVILQMVTILQSKYSMLDGCIFYGVRVVIPKILQGLVLKELHNNLARSHYFWQAIDDDIDKMFNKCGS